MRSSIRRLIGSSALLVLSFAAVSNLAYAQSPRERMVGTWKLVAWSTVFGGVEEPVAMGKGATGLITYAPDGYMCVNIMGPNRPKFASPDFAGGKAEEKAAAFETFIGYCGRYEVNETERFVVHTLQTSWYPNWTGTAQKRFVEMTADRIRLSNPPILAEGKEVVGLVWERAK